MLTRVLFGLAALLAAAAAFTAEVEDFRRVSGADLIVDEFSDAGAGADFTEILFDLARYQMVVGARDSLYRLGLEGLTKLERATWEVDENNRNLCMSKGQSKNDCRNFIKVLVMRGDRVFACGTHAFSPKCSWRKAEQINSVVMNIDGRGKCPHSPHDNSTARMTDDGDYYIGSAIDFSSNDHAIYRMAGSKFERMLRTEQYNALWLTKPDFVASFETDRFVYFLFREAAVEAVNCGKAVYSRIARICKNDNGGKLFLKDNWTTFLKARLNCSYPGDYPFYFDEIQSAYYLEETSTVYATFTSGENDIPGSAVCSFGLDAIEEAFASPFKTRERSDATWEPKDDDHAHFECGDSDGDSKDRSHLAVSSRQYQLVNSAVQPTTGEKGPILSENLVRYTHIAADAVSTKADGENAIHVIFVATRDGVIKKFSHNAVTKETCLVEQLRPFGDRKSPVPVVHNMKFLEATNSLYLATSESVLRIPTHRCGRFRTKQECLNSMDPYCGWNNQKSACTLTPNKNPRAAYWQQNAITCPVLTDPVDGGWSGWSDWFRCDYTTAGRESRHNGDDNAFCNCRKRVCDSPAPANGGIDCDSLGLEVTNCTQHGGWTAWSAFSACSKTCDVGMKHRKRTCGNPTPAFGGEGCIGRDVDSQYCDDLPPCSASSSPAAASSAALVRHGSWTQWAEWSECSALCGKGFRLRTRKCYGAAECVGGCDRDYQECEGRRKDCSSVSSDVMEVTDWTPWIRSNSSINGAYYEKRFRFTYRGVDGADVTGSDNLREEERFCQGRNQCSVTSVRGGSSRTPYSNSWSEWSKCSRECGSGYQVRIRSNGLSVVERPCNTRPCTGSWSCWSEWSVGCDHRGKKTRTRECDAGKFPLSSEVVCQGGSDREEADCDSEGWGGWNDWSDDCDASGYQKRYRICLANQCIGDDQDRRPCPGISSDGTVAPGVTSPQQTATATIAGAVIVGFLIGAFTGAGIVYFFLVYRRLGRGANGSPHYVSAKSQNLYVSLPMLDLNRHNGGNNHYSSNQSDCGTMRSTTTTGSTLRSNKNSGGSVYGVRAGNGSVVSPVVDYETATIKRSHSQRNSSILVANGCNGTLNMRADLGEDNLFT